MKKSLLFIFVIASVAKQYTASAQAGSLDPAFGTGGIVITPIGGGSDGGKAVAIQTDGKLIVAGSAYNGTDADFAMVRYNKNGTLDNTFGVGGVVLTDFGGLDDGAESIKIQNDGKIVLAGSTGLYTNQNIAVARYNVDGTLDNTFDTDGKLITDFGSDDFAYSATIQADGKIVVVGGSGIYPDYDFALARYNTDGSLDNSFDSDGKVLTSLGNNVAVCNSVTIQADDKIVVVGWNHNGTDYDCALARYNTDGSLDNSFNTNGKIIIALGNSDDALYSVAMQSDDKIVAVGAVYNTGGYNDFVLVRYNTDGTIDTGFDTDGIVTTDLAGGVDEANSVALQSDGKIMVAGTAYIGASSDFGLTRYNSDGSLDNTFDIDGKVLTDFASSYDYGFAIALQGDGKIVLAGYSYNGTDNDFAMARYLIGVAPIAPSNLILTPLKILMQGKMQLNWQDNSTDEIGFIIEHSLDGSSWLTVDSVLANNITYADTGLASNTNYYYRVSSYNNYGSSSYSSVINAYTLDGIQDLLSNSFISIYPNPTTGKIQISNIKLQIEEVGVYNMLGERVKYEMLKQVQHDKIEIDLTSQPSGIYFVEIKSENEKVFKKIIKE